MLLEKVCASFGTQLGEASINPYNGTKLVRIGSPVKVTGSGGGEYLIQFQLTRFSPVLSEEFHALRRRHLATKLEKDADAITGDGLDGSLEVEHPKWDQIAEITDTSYFPEETTFRWKKAVYVAVYALPVGDVRPFHIRENDTELDGKPPTVHLAFNISPRFAGGQSWDKIMDTLRISYPEIANRHQKSTQTALGLHPLNLLSARPEQESLCIDDRLRNISFSACVEIPSTVCREQTLGWICAYLRHFALGENFYYG